MTMHNATRLPITMSDPHKDVLPHTYVAWKKSQFCRNCSSMHSFTELYAKTHLKSRFGQGAPVTNLRRLDEPRYNLPVERIEGKTEVIPFCHMCYISVDLSDLPNIPVAEPNAATVLNAMAVVRNTPQREGDPEPKPAAKARKGEMGLNDILDF